MQQLTCVSAFLRPQHRLAFTRCQIVPGIYLQKLSAHLKNAIDSSNDAARIRPQFGATHVISIEENTYLERLRERLAEEGETLPKRSFVEWDSLARQAFLSLILAGPISFVFQGAHTFKIEANGPRRMHLAGYAHGPAVQVSETMATVILQATNEVGAITPARVRRIAASIDRYFRSGMWWTDRLAMAIGFFWDSLCTPSTQQAFLGMTNALESLLSTQSMEITHILAERVAVLTEATQERRLGVYRQMKDLYKIRSKIAHGNAFPRKGRQTSESLIVSAKRSNVPISSLTQLYTISKKCIVSVLRDSVLRQIIQNKRGEEKTSRDIDRYFAEALFRR